MKLIYSLYFFLLTGSVFAANPETLKELAISRDAQAQYELGQLYQRGDGVKQDPVQAFYWIEQAAENGHVQAQSDVADFYLTGTGTDKDLNQAIYWLTLLASHEDIHAQVKLGQLFEQQTPQLSAQDIALIWYRVAATRDLKAEKLYSQLLEQKFNQQRAKQISQIKLLDKLLVQTPAQSESEASTSTTQTEHNSGQIAGHTFSWIIVLVLSVITMLVIRQRNQNKQRQTQKHTDQQAKQLAEQRHTIRKQKQQLTALFQELKKLQEYKKVQQSHPSNPERPYPAQHQKAELACALFGYTQDHIPDVKQIKLRYKQLSKIYHPDLKGSDDEMKRLNQSLKIILALKKQ